MKILQLCKKFPFPLKDGESIAVTYLGRALHEMGCEVSLLAMNTTKHYYDLKQLPKSFNHYQHIWTTPVDNRIKVWDAFCNLFSSASYNITRFVSEDYKAQLINILQNHTFDVIQLETLYLTPYIDTIRQYSDAKIVMRSHNVEFEIWERLTINEKNPIKKRYLGYLTEKLYNFEVAQLQKIDALMAITARDLEQYQRLGFHGEGRIIPIGLDLNRYKTELSSFDRPLKLSFIGSLDWAPNIEGLRWFLAEVWPLIHATYPNLEFHIAGRNTPEDLKKTKINKVFIHGEVPDAQEFIAKYSLMLVPLLSGGGMRAKILEGMAMGKVILSTSIGLEGIDVVNGQQAYIANQPEEFRAAIQYCHAQNGELKQMGQQARQLIDDGYDNIKIATNVMHFYDEICGITTPVSKNIKI